MMFFAPKKLAIFVNGAQPDRRFQLAGRAIRKSLTSFNLPLSISRCGNEISLVGKTCDSITFSLEILPVSLSYFFILLVLGA